MIGRLLWLLVLLCFVYAVAVHQPVALCFAILFYIWFGRKNQKNPRRSIRHDV